MAKGKVLIKLMPPYRRPGHSGEIALIIPEEGMTLRQLANHVSVDCLDALAVSLTDSHSHHLYAEFIVNGKYALPEETIAEKDEVIIFQRIGGG